MEPCLSPFDAARFQSLPAGQSHRSGPVTITHTGNSLGEVRIAHGDASMTVSLRKGGTIVSAVLRGEEVFEQDPAYADLAQVTRTRGNPNIFPVFNQMPDGVCLPGAQTPLPNHGVARQESWEAFISDALPGALILRLRSNAHTQQSYPHAFTYMQCLTLEPAQISIAQQIDTEGVFAVGFHPYFRVSDKLAVDISGIAAGTRYWYLPNALSKRDKDAVIAADQYTPYVPGRTGSLNFAAGEVNHHFDMVGQSDDIVLNDPGLRRRIILQRTPDYHGVTVWSEAQASAVCIEPVTDRSGFLSAKLSPWLGRVTYRVEALP
ncbi:MAG: hypothetical protein AB7N91_11335 [Candidatus Tectimicrobiota bacterium]